MSKKTTTKSSPKTVKAVQNMLRGIGRSDTTPVTIGPYSTARQSKVKRK